MRVSVSKEFSKVMGKENDREWTSNASSMVQVVQKVDNFIQRISCCQASKCIT